MILKKLHFIIYILLTFTILGCKKEIQPILETKNNISEIEKFIAFGENFYESAKYDSSYYYFNKAKLACNPETDAKHYIYSISNLATIQQNQGDYSGSEATAMEAMPILETTTNPKYKWNIYTILGINYLSTYDYNSALNYFNSALDLKTDEPRNNATLNNIALTYMEQGEYQKALKILLPMALDDRIKDNPTENSQIINNIGYCYFKTGNSKSFNFLTRSLKIRTALKNDWILITSYYNLSLFYEKYNLNLSRKYAQLSYDKATSLNNVDIRLESLKLLIRNSTGEPLKKYTTNYIHINDSITKIRQQAKNQFAKIKYDSKKDKDENLILKAQKVENALQLQLHKNTTLSLYFAVGIILTITSFIYFYLISKSKKERVKTSYDTEVRIAKKLHDELANDVYQTMVFTETHDLSTSHNKDMLLDKLDTIYSRTRNISKENSNIPVGIDFLPNLKEMISGFSTPSATILIHGADSIPWHILSDIKKITVYRVLQELLINMIKHSEASLTVLSFKKDKNNFQLDYTDNGTGTELEHANLKNGLQNVENRLLAIKGTIAFETKPNKGFKSTVIFPI